MDSEDDSDEREPLAKWRKVYVVVMFVLRVVPLLGVIAYPALTGTSPTTL